MTQIDTTCEHTKIRLIAAALGHQQCTRTAASLIPLPGTDRVIAIGTAEEVARLLDANHLAGQSQATRAVPEGFALVPAADSADEIVSRLYRRFKEWAARGFGPEDVTWCEVKADVLAMIAATDPPQEVTQQAAPGDAISAIAGELEDAAIPYEGDFADTVRGCVEALRDLIAPVTQRAAKAETAEQPTAEDITRLSDLMDEWANAPSGQAARAVYRRIVKAIDSHFLAPTTSTVSAPDLLQEARELLQAAEPDATQDKSDSGMCAQWDVDALALIKRIDSTPSSTVSAPEEVRNQALEDAEEACKAERVEDVGPCDAAYNLATDHCIKAIRALRTTSGKGDAA